MGQSKRYPQLLEADIAHQVLWTELLLVAAEAITRTRSAVPVRWVSQYSVHQHHTWVWASAATRRGWLDLLAPPPPPPRGIESSTCRRYGPITRFVMTTRAPNRWSFGGRGQWRSDQRFLHPFGDLRARALRRLGAEVRVRQRRAIEHLLVRISRRGGRSPAGAAVRRYELPHVLV